MSMGNTPEFTHLDESGNAHMVDVTAKNATARRAVARCTVTMKPETAAAISTIGLVVLSRKAIANHWLS